MHERIREKSLWIRCLYAFGGYWTPAIYCVLLAMLRDPDWRYQFGHHYLFLIESDHVGWASLPLLCALAFWFSRKIILKKQISTHDLIPQTVVILSAAYYFLAVLAFGLTKNWETPHPVFTIFLLTVIVLYIASHVTILFFFRKTLSPDSRPDFWNWLWIAATLATLLIKVKMAKTLYWSLPEVRPPCMFTASALYGHPRIVQSYYDSKKGRIMNHQLAAFYDFEELLKKRTPKFHVTLRRFYNRFSPLIAKRLHNPLLADVAYWLLQPLEILTRLVLFLAKQKI